ncbi:alpha/beta hydrolase [Marinigracilibium pacificum]|uniref:Alpha/beta hydrolase n=1 Tax=Marinigracilibium pacificum TaxID=2729599 RepID=A0A848IY13_9BACT|nr:alpha/beta fold hydrolase [Marinigracilibium pacificum]NMM47170.1 alpha/beta hydrolase [Marinigracilibium pacificum]
MKKIIKLFMWILSAGAILYVFALGYIYFDQERFLFHPVKLNEDYIYQFDGEFEEVEIPVANDIYLNGLWFRAENSKGLVIFFHGNAGAIDKWGQYSTFYLQNGYDFFVYDYRGYGKSEGEIENTNHLLIDALVVYDSITDVTNVSNPIISGYSLGSGIASYVASERDVKALMLFAPYYSLRKTAIDAMPFFPGNIMRYNIETANYMREINCPVYIFHGLNDRLILPDQSLQLTEIPGTRVKRFTYNDVAHDVFGNSLVEKDVQSVLSNID